MKVVSSERQIVKVVILQIHETARPAPVEEKPEWMNNDKARKLDSLPENFPRTYKSWGFPGQFNNTGGDL